MHAYSAQYGCLNLTCDIWTTHDIVHDIVYNNETNICTISSQNGAHYGISAHPHFELSFLLRSQE